MQDKNDRVNRLATRRLIQIPGPNPVIRMGDEGDFDERLMEAGEILKDLEGSQELYYFYYHGRPMDTTKWPRTGYRIGVAVASQPLGPFTKPAQNPLVDLGPEGSWEDAHVACPCIIKHGPGQYIMWYSGIGKSEQYATWSVGIATASHPLGPWAKYEGNPIIDDCGYPGGVVLLDGTYYMYNAHPISSYAPDYSPFVVYTATDPYGPWEPWEGNPVIVPGGWGAWDDGGYSEGKVVFHDGVFHAFYGGAKEGVPRMRTMESIGYAVSGDGYHFTKHVDNPVALREKNPDASAFAEVQCLFDPPFIYLYHTHRYLSSEDPDIEDLGIQVLATATPFKLSMPVLHQEVLAAGTTTELAACPPICLENISDLALGVRCNYSLKATAGVRVHVRASYDGFAHDTEDWATFDNGFAAGQESRRTVAVSARPQFIRVMVENLDTEHGATGLRMTATMGS